MGEVKKMRLRPFKRDFFESRGSKGVSTSKIRPIATMGDLEKTHLRSFKRNFLPVPTTKGVPGRKIRPTAGSLRSDCRQGSSPLRGAPLVPRSASLTASSLRLRSFYGELALPFLTNKAWMIASEEENW
jgi:hypothetical protein